MTRLRRKYRARDCDVPHRITQGTGTGINALNRQTMELKQGIFSIERKEIAARAFPGGCEILNVGEEARLILCFQDRFIGGRTEQWRDVRRERTHGAALCAVALPPLLARQGRESHPPPVQV